MSGGFSGNIKITTKRDAKRELPRTGSTTCRSEGEEAEKTYPTKENDPEQRQYPVTKLKSCTTYRMKKAGRTRSTRGGWLLDFPVLCMISTSHKPRRLATKRFETCFTAKCRTDRGSSHWLSLKRTVSPPGATATNFCLSHFGPIQNIGGKCEFRRRSARLPISRHD